MSSRRHSTEQAPSGLNSALPVYVTLVLLNFLLLIPVGFAEFAPETPNRLFLSAIALVSIALSCGFAAWIRRHRAHLASPADTLNFASIVWAIVLCLPVAAAIAFSSEAAYSALALYVIVLWLLPQASGIVGVLVLCLGVIAGQAVHHGWSVGGILGPAVSAVAIIALLSGYRAMVRVAARNLQLAASLQRTSEALAASERTAGQEAERARLGRDLHDTTAQHLSSIRLLLAAAGRTPEQSKAHEYVQQADELSQHALSEIREIIDDLSPRELTGVTLVDALRRLCDKPVIAHQDAAPRPIPVTYSADEAIPQVSTHISTSLFRVAGEALANAAKYSEASQIHVRLSCDQEQLTLEIDDDGVGFHSAGTHGDQAPPRSDTSGHGLPSMRERLRELGGSLIIVSEPGEGTLIRADVPVIPATDSETAQPERTAK
jgi:signal transduction histidine kinase